VDLSFQVTAMEKLSLWTLLQIYFRSFFSQGSFSVKYRQNIGFAFCLEPAGKQIWKDREDRRKFYLRHLEFYNGNPFMVTLVLGAVARMEERLRDHDGIEEEDINRFKTAVGQAVGSVGDRFFWRTLRPFMLVMGLLAACFAGAWGAAAFLVLFNLPVLYLRWHWLLAGYKLGPKVVIEIRNPRLETADGIMETLGGITIAFLVIAFLAKPVYQVSWVSAGAAVLFLFGLFLTRRRVPPSVILFLSAAIAVGMGAIIP